MYTIIYSDTVYMSHIITFINSGISLLFFYLFFLFIIIIIFFFLLPHAFATSSLFTSFVECTYQLNATLMGCDNNVQFALILASVYLENQFYLRVWVCAIKNNYHICPINLLHGVIY